MSDIHKLITRIQKHLQERGWDNLNPSSLVKSITIEAGELLEHFQWSEPSKEEIKASPKKLQDIGEELADVMIYCLQLADKLDLDVSTIINDKLDKVALKYPADLVKGDDKAYWKLKRKHRKEGTN